MFNLFDLQHKQFEGSDTPRIKEFKWRCELGGTRKSAAAGHPLHLKQGHNQW